MTWSTPPVVTSITPSTPRLPFLTATGGALLIAFSAIFVRLADVTPATAAVFRCAYALPLLAVLAARERRHLGPRVPRDRRIAIAAGVFFAVDLLFWHTAIEFVGAGLSTVLVNTQVALVPLVAWAVLGERPGARVVAAVPAALAGVVLISGVLDEGAYGADPARGVVFGLLTALSYCGFLLTLRRGNRDVRRPAGPLLDATWSAMLVSVAAGLALGQLDPVPQWPAHGWLALLAISSQVVAWMLISVSLPRLPAAVTSVLLLVQPVGSVVLGVVLLGESPSSPQVAGVVVILAAILLATARSSRAGPRAPGGRGSGGAP